MTQKRMIVRIGHNMLSFLSLENGKAQQAHASIDMKSGISVSANLREAFKTLPLLEGQHPTATVMTDTATTLVPDEEFAPEDAAVLFDHTFSGHQQEPKLYTEMPRLHAVAVFAVPKDLQTVLSDRFSQVEYMPVCLPVWQHFGQRADGARLCLYGYFHDDKLDLFAFSKHRFKFCNVFSATHSHDALYYLLSAFTQLGMKADRDEVMLMGVTPHLKWLADNLTRYISRTTVCDTEAVAAGSSAPLAFPLDTHLLLTGSPL